MRHKRNVCARGAGYLLLRAVLLTLLSYAHLPKAESISLGVGIAERAVSAYLGLLPLYSMSLH